jgi:ribosomal protein S18 acetylase RimI-like enzyme
LAHRDTDQVEIRDARSSDAWAIAEVHVAGWRWGYRGMVDPAFLAGLSTDQRADFWSRTLGNPEAEEDVFVAETNGTVVGFASIGRSGDDDASPETGELLTLYLLEEVAGLGIGSRLLRRAHERLRERGFARATLWVLDANERARRLYERHGWRPEGRVKVEQPGVTLREVRYAIDLS